MHVLKIRLLRLLLFLWQIAICHAIKMAYQGVLLLLLPIMWQTRRRTGSGYCDGSYLCKCARKLDHKHSEWGATVHHLDVQRSWNAPSLPNWGSCARWRHSTVGTWRLCFKRSGPVTSSALYNSMVVTRLLSLCFWRHNGFVNTERVYKRTENCWATWDSFSLFLFHTTTIDREKKKTWLRRQGKQEHSFKHQPWPVFLKYSQNAVTSTGKDTKEQPQLVKHQPEREYSVRNVHVRCRAFSWDERTIQIQQRNP